MVEKTIIGSVPLIAVIVLSYKGRATLAAAVRSLCAQEISAEIVVVHSGGGEVEAQLAGAGLKVRVIKSEARLFPGAARNLGIRETRAPFVAFLADDCTAEPGWLRERLRAHEEGEAAVASALLCHEPNNPVALAAHMSLYIRRMPRMKPALALAYGASYARHLFDTYGFFRDDLESGEDTEFHLRLPPAHKPIWRPEVCTVHTGVATLGAYLTNQFRRGRRIAEAWGKINGPSGAAVAKDALKRTVFIIGHALKVVEHDQRRATLLAMPLIALGNLVYAFGAITGGRRA